MTTTPNRAAVSRTQREHRALVEGRDDALVCAEPDRQRRLVHWEEIGSDDLAYRRETPDEALDGHTQRGRQMGRGAKHFFEKAARLVNPDGEDVSRRGDDYERRMLEMWEQGGNR